MSSPFISFELTSAQVLALATTSPTLFTFATNANVARVPVRLVLSKPAGTAYVAAGGSRLEAYDEDGNVWFSVDAAGLLASAAATGRVVAPNLGAVSSGNVTLSLRSTGALTVGDSVLKGRLYFDEVPIIW